ncbi:MAG TPA: family 10 glycosylhydrolase [Bryobacteraceae bacterium]|nr:family 10 glycosylhydrolase [Bryobacteraceae bacterium]
MKPVTMFAMLILLCAVSEGQQDWWMREPIRWLQTNLRETDASLDPGKYVAEVSEFNANVLLMAMGGISAFYPSRVQYHYVSPSIPSGHDTFGEVLKQAHARSIRVVGRFDFSKARKDAYEAHPEWFFKRSDGEPAVYNGLYQACVNGGWYREKAVEILTEALERYDVDGLFFNMFSNPASDYSGHPLGLCHCDNCQRLFRARFGRNLPERPDADYESFLHAATVSMSETIRQLIKSKRPTAALVGTSPDIADMVFSESNTAVRRALPLWPYASSDNVNRARNTYPQKQAINQCMSFLDYPWRFAMVPREEIRTRLWQNVANGGPAAINVHGTLEQEDRTALEAAKPIFAWLKQHESYFTGQTPEARVLLLGGGARGFRSTEGAYRGMFRLLSEEHIPFGVVDNLDWLGKREVDLVIAAGEAPKELEQYVRNGGNVVIASPVAPPFDMGEVVKLWKDPDGAYLRIRDKTLFPSLKNTDVTFVYGDYLEVRAKGPLTFIPPSMYGPPEFVHVDWKDTDAPGLILKQFGKGTVAWLPWNLGALYYLHSSEAHAGLMRDLIDHLLPQGRQLKTDAHPLVEVTLMSRGDRRLVHLVNISGHSETAYFSAVPMNNISVQVKGTFRSARAVRAGKDLALTRAGGYSEFRIPSLADYELVELR